MRYLGSGAATLVHQLYSDASRTVVWGSWGYGGAAVFGSGGVARNINLNILGSGSSTFTVYGRVIGNQQTAAPGTYTWTTNAPIISYGYGSTTCGSSPGSGVDNAGSSSWTAVVPKSCQISTSPLNFGTVTTLTSNRDATGSLTILCTNTTPYSVGINNGSNASGSQRRMRLGATANYISYNLFTDAARTSAWGSSTSATTCTSGAGTCVLGIGSGTNQTVTVYGRVPPQGAPPVGTYSDTVIVTVTF